jgi:hypothetical protein
MAIDYMRFDERQLDRLLAQSKRSEQDLERRLSARLELAARSTGSNPDPIPKRLRFLLAKVRKQRCAIEGELAARRRYDASPLRGSDVPATARCATMNERQTRIGSAPRHAWWQRGNLSNPDAGTGAYSATA